MGPVIYHGYLEPLPMFVKDVQRSGLLPTLSKSVERYLHCITQNSNDYKIVTADQQGAFWWIMLNNIFQSCHGPGLDLLETFPARHCYGGRVFFPGLAKIRVFYDPALRLHSFKLSQIHLKQALFLEKGR